MKKTKYLLILITVLLGVFTSPTRVLGQGPTGTLQGRVLDPSGAVIPQAQITVTSASGKSATAVSDGGGSYQVRGLTAGAYTVNATTAGFAPFTFTVTLAAGQAKTLNIAMQIETEKQQVQVEAEAPTVDTSPDENANAVVLKGKDLDALSDDPDELESQLHALAGPAAGPNGGEVYIDGFTGGQIPPKSSIREIRVNQNPFSAEFDKIGYGRIEILTKPGSDKFSGHITSLGNDSAWNTANPLVQQQPSYYLYFIQADVNGPLTKSASYFFSLFRFDRQNQTIIDAVNPDDTSTKFNQALPNPSSLLVANPRIDFQLGKSNTLSVRDSYVRSVATANGPGQLNLPEQAFNVKNQENAIQVSDTVVVNPRVINETHFQWRRVRNSQIASYFTPTVTVQGAFTTGGSNSGVARDHQDIFELQNYSTATASSHTIRFGARLRSYRDANYSTAGSNGNYLFTSIDQYLAQTPAQYQATVIQNPLARAILFDGALFYQDDWRARRLLTLSLAW